MGLTKYSLLLPVLLLACTKEIGRRPFCETHASQYNSVIFPIINAKCAVSGCHAGGSPFGNYETFEGLKAKITKGTFTYMVYDKKIMPPANKPQLNEEELKLIKCWLDSGSPNN